jgi:hypothetical protein
MSKIIREAEEAHQPFTYPSHEDVRNFMEHGRNDEMNLRSHAGLKDIPSETLSDGALFNSMPQPHHGDLLEILHK